MNRLTDNQYKQFKSYLEQGLSILQIESLLGISRKTLYRIKKQDNLQQSSYLDTITNKEDIISYWKVHTNVETQQKFSISERHLYQIIKWANLDLKYIKSKTDIYNINKETFINYYRDHSYKNTKEFFKLSDNQIKKLLDKFGCEKREKSFDSFLANFDIESFLKDYYILSNKELQNKYNISEAFYYKLIKKYNLDNRKRANSNLDKVFKTLDKNHFLDYLKSHTIQETSNYFNIASNIVSQLSLKLLGKRKYPKETTDQTIIRILKEKDQFLKDYYFLSLEALEDKWHVHPRKLSKIEDKLGIPHRQLKMEITKNTNIKKYGVPYACMRPEAKNFKGSNSKPNLGFEQLLKTNKIKYTREFSLNNFMYDFKINNTLIEIDPARTHSPDVSCYNKQIDKNYHKQKSEIASENGYRCIHVWEWDDPEKIINCFIKPKETIYARNCQVKLVDKEEAKTFIDKYHVQNYGRDTIRLGLYYKEDLISIMTFGRPRYNKNYQYELVRYCSKAKVIGGAEKLFKHFIQEFKPDSIISYCDLSKFTGETYNKLRFKKLRISKPSAHWFNHNTNQHITDNLLRQRGFDQLFGTNYGKGTSNEQLMLENGFVRVYDCGQVSYIWRKGE